MRDVGSSSQYGDDLFPSNGCRPRNCTCDSKVSAVPPRPYIPPIHHTQATNTHTHRLTTHPSSQCVIPLCDASTHDYGYSGVVGHQANQHTTPYAQTRASCLRTSHNTRTLRHLFTHTPPNISPHKHALGDPPSQHTTYIPLR